MCMPCSLCTILHHLTPTDGDIMLGQERQMLSLTPWNKHDLGIRPLADRCVGGGVGGRGDPICLGTKKKCVLVY